MATEQDAPRQGGEGWAEVKGAVDALNQVYSEELKGLKSKAEDLGETLQELVKRDPVARDQFEQIDQKMADFEKRLQRPATGGVQAGDEVKTYGIEELPNGTMRATSKATREQLGDAAFNMEEQLRLDFREAFQVSEGAAFVTGNGVGKPEGFMTNSDVDASTVTGVASDLSYTGIVDLAHGLNANYIANARYVMNLATLGKVRLLEDTGGNLLFLPPSQGMPSTIAGFPWTVLQDMPDVAASATPIAFGDFRRAYYIVERVMFDLLRDPYTSKRDGAIEFTAFMRVGGQVVLPTAIRKLTVST